MSDADLWKLSILIEMFFPSCTFVLWDVWKFITPNAVSWKTGNRSTVEEKARHGAGIVHVRVLKEALLIGILALFVCGQRYTSSTPMYKSTG